jgi:hypothetical protein
MGLAKSRTIVAAALTAAAWTGGCCLFDNGNGNGNGNGPGPCVDFEDPALNTTYAVGDTFQDSGVTITVKAFQWSNGTWHSGGSGRIVALGRAGGSAQEANANNVNFAFGFPRITRLALRFGELGGNVNLKINGDFRNFANLQDIQGLTIGGVTATVTGGTGNDMGTLTLQGVIEVFEIGGQELWLDDVCPSGVLP